jgi:hypothetical protein
VGSPRTRTDLEHGRQRADETPIEVCQRLYPDMPLSGVQLMDFMIEPTNF